MSFSRSVPGLLVILFKAFGRHAESVGGPVACSDVRRFPSVDSCPLQGDAGVEQRDDVMSFLQIPITFSTRRSDVVVDILSSNSTFARTTIGGNLNSFSSGMIVYVLATLCFVGMFVRLREKYEVVYADNVLEGIAPMKPERGAWGWVRASWQTTTDEAAKSIGLDNAMLLEFTNLGRKMLGYLSILLVGFLGPLQWAFGGNAAGEDRLNFLSLANVQSCGVDDRGNRLNPDFDGCWLYYVHAMVTWIVVFLVQVFIYKAQRQFIPRRMRWLHELPDPRAATVLVEGIPDEYRSDDLLKAFFGDMFCPSKIKSAYVVKRSAPLEQAIAKLKESKSRLERCTGNFKNGTSQQDLLRALRADIAGWEQIVEIERKKFMSVVDSVGGVNCSTGFVTFNELVDAEVALNLQYGADRDELVVSAPPEPASILWEDLQQTRPYVDLWSIFGYIMVLLLCCVYMPLIIGVTNLGVLPLGPIWAALAPTMGLQLLLSFLPAILTTIFRWTFVDKAEAWSQRRLQTWHFNLLVLFVIFGASIGTNILRLRGVVTQPFTVFPVVADTMPVAANFYWLFLVLQWVMHALELFRYSNIARFFVYRAVYPEMKKKELLEIEWRSHLGIGTRSSRFSLVLVIAIVFGTISPPLTFLAYLSFCFSRLVYGYLIPFAESKESDLGGAFWVAQLKQIFVGNVIYCILMIGVLLRRAQNYGPMLCTIPSLLYVLWSAYSFNRRFAWERPPFTALVQKQAEGNSVPRKVDGEYRQLELFGE